MADGQADGRRGVDLRPAHVRAFLCLAEARHVTSCLARANGSHFLWPGFDFAEIPIILFTGNREAFLVQHPDPPAEFHLLPVPIPGLEITPLYYHRGALPYLPAVGVVDLEGRATATLPLSVFRPDAVPETLVAGLVHEAFHAYESGLGEGRLDLSLLGSYPELSATNNALGNLEACILHDYLEAHLGYQRGPGDGPSGRPPEPDAASAGKAAADFSLVRRERRGPLDDDMIDYERRLERVEGSARYVQLKVLLGTLSAAYRPSKAFAILTGREAYSRASRLVAEQIDKLPELNIKAAGAAWWRFFHTGMALALLADHLDPQWKTKVMAGRALDALIERRVVYDGGTADERALELLKEHYGYDERLEIEREFGRQEKKRKEGLLATLLAGTGTRITFDVSALIPEETYLDSGRFALVWDPASVEIVTRNVRIHRRGLRFSGFGTDLRFGDLPVVEDINNRLFHVSVPKAGRFDMSGDGQRHSLDKPAEFEDGLEVVLPGVSAKARSGFVRNAGGTLYIKITR